MPENVDTSVFKQLHFSHRGSILIYNYVVPDKMYIVADLFERVYTALHKLLSELVLFFNGIRVSLRLICSLEEVKYEISEDNAIIGSPFTILTHPNFIQRVLQDSVGYIILSLNAFVERGSEWVVKSLDKIEVTDTTLDSSATLILFFLISMLNSYRYTLVYMSL